MATYTDTTTVTTPAAKVRMSCNITNNSDESNNAIRVQVKVGADWVTISTHKSSGAKIFETASQPIRYVVTGTVQYDLFDVV